MESLPKPGDPEEELAMLRAQVSAKEALLRQGSAGQAARAIEQERPRIISEQIAAHRAAPAEAVLAGGYAMNRHDLGNIAQDILLSFELKGDEAALAALVKTVEEKGVKNALSAVEKLGSPRVEDLFHDFLVRYIASGMRPAGAAERGPRFKALHMTLYEIMLPEKKDQDQRGRERPLKELLSAMEQLYAGMLSVGSAAEGEPEYFAFELGVAAASPELKFYAAIPNHKRDLFEKQLLAIYPGAQIAPKENDYTVFAEGASVAGAAASLAHNPVLPLKDYADFDYDPLNAITNAFAKIEKEGEGAALQVIIEPRGERHVEHYKKILQALRKGEKRASAFSLPESAFGEIARDLGKTLFSAKPKDEQKAKEAETRQIEENKAHVEQVEKKLAAPIAGVTIRIVAAAKDPAKADQVVSELEAAFNQFANTQGNSLAFTHATARRAQEFFEEFSFRLPGEAMPLSLRELTALYHFPPQGLESSPHLAQARFKDAPAPAALPQQGALLGVNRYRGAESKAYLEGEDRLRHLYVVGQTGTGKSTLLQNLIAQDIKAGEGCCYIDPHGGDILDILAAVPPERYEDVIYFDPAELSRPFGLNFLEYDPAKPEQKTFIVNELLMIFRRLYGDVPESLGPAFEQYFRNATQLVMEDPASGSTVLDIARVLSNSNFRKQKLAASKNPIVNQFWQEIATKAGGEASLENIVPYITNKFDDFTANDFIRPIVGQQESSFNFRRVMDEKKILLVNLSKGRLGEKNANLLGLIIVGKLFMAALSRADNPKSPYPPFYLYIDEFQNVTTDSVPGILSEARKYKLSLTIAHQFLAQIEEKFRDAIFGNVGNMAVFRVGQEDGEVFEKLYAPVFSASDFTNIENRNAYVKILANGVPQKPFNIATMPPPAGNEAQIADLIQLSALTYGRDRATIEETIRERYLA
ncbi:MAG TPA: TraM recognition domain-containing protein [Candidatus Paceibacterota bacterium]|nr:TraM recognition domain-containing protein [Candidatus Paceibacterota bacterium]